MESEILKFYIKDLRCEYLINPLGIDFPKPRLSWKLHGERKGLSQIAYQIQCSNKYDNFNVENLIWNTGKIESSKSIQIPYNGPILQSRMIIYWRVRIWNDLEEASGWSEIGWWEMGLLQKSDWTAIWIDPEGKINSKELQPVAYLRKNFKIPSSFKKARLYATAHGVYETYINGERVGDIYFSPGITAYIHRIQYQVYNITEYLKVGDNCIGAVIGDGWWRGSSNAENIRNRSGERIALLAQIEIELENGQILYVVTDSSWRATSGGPYRYSDLKIGDYFDGNKIIENWTLPEFIDSEWNHVRVVDFGYDNLIGTSTPPVREKERIHPDILMAPDKSTMLDFKQNLGGYIECLFTNLPKDQKIVLEFGETLDKNGNFTQKNFEVKNQKVQIQKDVYIHPGRDNLFKNKFSLKGFRYVRITGHPLPLNPQNFTAIALYTDMEQTGDFHCSHPLINQLVKNTRWSQKGNFLEIPTDCPTRERNGWTGDAQIFGYTGSFLMNIAPIYRKWIMDVALEQKRSGKILSVVPNPQKVLKLAQGCAGWGDAILIIPNTLKKMYGEDQLFKELYKYAKNWVDYERKRARKTRKYRKLKPKNWSKEKRQALRFLWDKGFQFGEWLEAELTPEQHKKEINRTIFYGNPEVATAYFAYSSRLLSDWAADMGKDTDAQFYFELYEKVLNTYKMFALEDGMPISTKQAPHVRPVALGLVDEEQAYKIISKLNDLIKNNDYHLGTGFLSTPFLLPVLSEHGYLDTAYKLLEQTSIPSWLYQITKGATTIWESWHGILEDGTVHASHNHYSYGAVVSWLFDTVAGIKYDLKSLGYKHFYLVPQPGGSLTYAKAEFKSMYGKIISFWEKEPEIGIQYRYLFEIPPNTSATIMLKNTKLENLFKDNQPLTQGKGIVNISSIDKGARIEVTAGRYSLEEKK
ncbi:MAG: family 78 glycoside hydrolase catalytic domain [Promethearchaeota archaeon]